LPDYQTLEVDLSNTDAVRALLAHRNLDFVFNLASFGVNPADCNEDESRALNATLPQCLAECLRNSPQTRLIHVGSAAEYGNATGDLSETTTCQPTTVYGRTKLEGTEFILKARANAVVARLFTVYGAGERDGRLLPALFRACEEGTPIDLTEGRQERDFTHVDDVVEGILRLAISANPPGLVNLATGKLLAVRNFCRQAADIIGLQEEHLRFGAKAGRDDEMNHDPVSNAQLLSATAWKPDISVDDGIKQTWKARLRSRDS
jgi:nucleoside-diphosphate-sugar epimerase